MTVGHPLDDNTLLIQASQLNFRPTCRKRKNPETSSEASSSKQRKTPKANNSTALEGNNSNNTNLSTIFENMNMMNDQTANVTMNEIIAGNAEGSSRIGNVEGSSRIEKCKRALG